jgi:glutathione S-transferase
MITLWGRRNSLNVQKCLWALGELGLEADVRRVGGQFGGFDAEYLALNPNGYVPTLRDGDLVLSESDAILRWLARRHGAGRLWRSEAEFAVADQWATWGTVTFYPTLAPLFFALVRTPRAEQDVSTLGPAAEALARTAAILDRRLADSPYLCGDAFSFGDIGPAITARRAVLLPWGAPVGLPHLRRWLDDLSARPAFRDHIDMPLGGCLEEWREIEERLG